MKKRFLLLGLLVILHTNIYAQCCPYIDSLYILPENPQTDDSVQFVYSVATPTISYLLSRTVLIEDTDIEVDVCYTATAATAISYFKDTLELGTLEAGTYEIAFRAALTGDTLVCYVDDYQSRSLLFSVEPTSSIENPDAPSSTRLFPNPASTVIWIETDSPFTRLRLLNSLGQEIYHQTTPATRQKHMSVSQLPEGIYWLEIGSIDLQAHALMPVVIQR